MSRRGVDSLLQEARYSRKSYTNTACHMRLEVVDAPTRTAGELVYRTEDFSFDIEPNPGGGFASLLVNDLQLEMDQNGAVFSVWGLCPHTSWVAAKLTPPATRRATVKPFEFGDEFVAGVGTRLVARRLPVQADSVSGWVRIGAEASSQTCVELLGGVLLEITEDGEFASLWLRPQDFPRVARVGA